MRHLALCCCMVAALASCQKINTPHDNSNMIKPIGTHNQMVLIRAKGADIKLDSEGASTGTLTLHSTSPLVVLLSSHATKQYGTVAISEFVKSWQTDRFTTRANHPNGAFFSFEDPKNEYADLDFILSNPSYDAVGKTLTFHFRGWNHKNSPTRHLNDVTVMVLGEWKNR